MHKTDDKKDSNQPFYPENGNIFPIFSLPTVNQFSGVMHKVIIACALCIFLGIVLITVGIVSIFVPSFGSLRIYHPLWIGSSAVLAAIIGIIGYRNGIARPTIMHINMIMNILSITATVGGCIICAIAIIEGANHHDSIIRIAAINLCLILTYLIIFSSFVYCIIAYFLIIRSPVILITATSRIS